MATLITIPAGTTKFKGYDKPRISKAKRYQPGGGYEYIMKSNKIICKNCHNTWGAHVDVECPEYQRIQY